MATKSKQRLSLSEHTLYINTRKCNYDKFDFREVDEYVQALAQDSYKHGTQIRGLRWYEYDAIRKIMIYLWGGGYENIQDLAEKNYEKKEAIQQRFHSKEHFLKLLPLPDRLSGVCHLATGTGKSYVMFAIAYLSIVMGKVKRVLVLGPSSTIIKRGLREKFKKYLFGEKGKALNEKLPSQYRNITVDLITRDENPKDFAIMVENINGVYQYFHDKENNAIAEFIEQPEEVLVLSDEVHHAYTHLKFKDQSLGYDWEGNNLGRQYRDERLWMKFIREEPKIKRHIGFTGTPYNTDEYFVDVLYNYSIREAIDDKIIKNINPIIKTESEEDTELTLEQRFEQILDTHYENKERYSYNNDNNPRVKPITIFVNPYQTTAQKRTNQFVPILSNYLRIKFPDKYGHVSIAQMERAAREKVICVISKPGEEDYEGKLQQIEEVNLDETGGKVEFVFAVNKLSEGWDVENVFQIVPMDDVAFNSKRKISQVLGRGLRLPRDISYGKILSNYPVVTVTNHEKFSKHIQELFNEVVECELRFVSQVLIDPEQTRPRHNFNLLHMRYLPDKEVVEKEDKKQKKIKRRLKLEPPTEKLNLKVIYRLGTKHFSLSKEFFTVDQIASEIARKYKNVGFEHHHFDFGDGFKLEKLPTRQDIEKIIKNAMEKANFKQDKLSKHNRQQIWLFFNSFLPQSTKKSVPKHAEGDVYGISTRNMNKISSKIGGVDSDVSVFLSEDYENEIGKDNQFIINELEKEHKQLKLKVAEGQKDIFSDSSLLQTEYIRQLIPGKNIFVSNTSLFKTPQDLVIASHAPEREFVSQLIEHGQLIDSWVKSADVNFYSIPYEYWKKGKDRVRRGFNPDFFIKLNLENYIEAVEQDKTDNQDSRQIKDLQDEGIEELILVVEIKGEDDMDQATEEKEKYALEHFEKLNRKLPVNPIDLKEQFRKNTNQYYKFFLLRPIHYQFWFQKLRTGKILS